MLKTLISSFFTKSVVAFTLLAVLLVSSRQLGSAVVGQVSLVILNLAIIQAISDIYTGSALVYFLSKHNLAKIYRMGLLWTVVCILVLNAVFYLFKIGVNELWIHVLVLSFISTLQAFHTVILLARENIRMYNFLVFFQPVVLLAVLCLNVFVLQIRTVNAYIIAMYVSGCSSFVVSTIQIIRILNEKDNRDGADWKVIIKNGFMNQLGNLAHILSNRYNYYKLEAIAIMLAGVYASATSLIESVWIITGSVSPVILTHIANQRDIPNDSKITFLLSKLCFLLSLICVLVIFIIPADFFTFLLGKDFSGTKSIMLYLSPGVLCISFSGIISHYYSGLGKQKILLLANSLGLLVTLCTSYFFISQYGVTGACYAASLSYFTQAMVLILIFMKQNKLALSDLFSFRRDLSLLRR